MSMEKQSLHGGPIPPETLASNITTNNDREEQKNKKSGNSQSDDSEESSQCSDRAKPPSRKPETVTASTSSSSSIPSENFPKTFAKAAGSGCGIPKKYKGPTSRKPRNAPPIVHPAIAAQYEELMNIQPLEADQYRITDINGNRIKMNWDQFFNCFNTMKKTAANETYESVPELSTLDLHEQQSEEVIGQSAYDAWILLEGLKFISMAPNDYVPGIVCAISHFNRYYPNDHEDTLERIEHMFDEFLQTKIFTLSTGLRNGSENVETTFRLTKVMFHKLTRPLMVQLTYSAASSKGDLDALSTHFAGYDFWLIGTTVVLPSKGLIQSFQCIIDWRMKDALQPPHKHKLGSTVQLLSY